MTDRSCSVCSASLSGDPRRRYCSTDCKAEAGRRRAAAWYAEHRDDPALKARMKAAAERHYLQLRTDPEAWAARLARTHEWRAQNRDTIRIAERAYWAANRDRKREKDHRRRARLLAAFVEDVDPAVVWIRDEGICGICLEAIDPTLAWPHKRAKTLDHVIPLARGGTHEYANVQLAHMDCNSRKSDRMLELALT